MSHTLGGFSSGGADALLSRTTLAGLVANEAGGNKLKGRRLELQLGYGFPAFSHRFTLTPELELGLYNGGRDYRIGWNLTHPDDGASVVAARPRETA